MDNLAQVPARVQCYLFLKIGDDPVLDLIGYVKGGLHQFALILDQTFLCSDDRDLGAGHHTYADP